MNRCDHRAQYLQDPRTGAWGYKIWRPQGFATLMPDKSLEAPAVCGLCGCLFVGAFGPGLNARGGA